VSPVAAKRISAYLLGTVAHRLHADGWTAMCVGFDVNSPYRGSYEPRSVETEAGSRWAIWQDVGRLAAQLPRFWKIVE